MSRMDDPTVSAVFTGEKFRAYMERLEQRMSKAAADIAATAAIAAAAKTSADAASAAIAALSLTLNCAFDTSNTTTATSSSSFIDVSGLSVTLTTTGGDVAVWVTGGALYNFNNGEETFVALAVDGGTDNVVAYYTRTNTTSSQEDNTEVPCAGFFLFTGLAAGSHTFKARYRTSSGGSARVNHSGTNLQLFALELALGT